MLAVLFLSFAVSVAGCSSGPGEPGASAVDEEIEAINSLLGLDASDTTVGSLDRSGRSCGGVPTDETYSISRAYLVPADSMDQKDALRHVAGRYRDLNAEIRQYRVSADGSRILLVVDGFRGIYVRFTVSSVGSAVVEVAWMSCGIEDVPLTGERFWVDEPVSS